MKTIELNTGRKTAAYGISRTPLVVRPPIFYDGVERETRRGFAGNDGGEDRRDPGMSNKDIFPPKPERMIG